MEIRPILATLRKHKLTAVLLTLQVAFTCAIVTNVAFMIVHRVQRVSLPTGIAEDELSVIRVEGTRANANPRAQHAADLAALRVVPGVESVVAFNGSLPLSRNSSFSGVCPTRQTPEQAMQTQSLGAACVQPGVYTGSRGLVATLSLDLIAGRDFRADEFVDDESAGRDHQPGAGAAAVSRRERAWQVAVSRVVLGVILAVGLNLLLMTHYELPRLPLWYLSIGAVALWILGQLAVLATALRAARVPPVVATRSV